MILGGFDRRDSDIAWLIRGGDWRPLAPESIWYWLTWPLTTAIHLRDRCVSNYL